MLDRRARHVLAVGMRPGALASHPPSVAGQQHVESACKIAVGDVMSEIRCISVRIAGAEDCATVGRGFDEGQRQPFTGGRVDQDPSLGQVERSEGRWPDR